MRAHAEGGANNRWTAVCLRAQRGFRSKRRLAYRTRVLRRGERAQRTHSDGSAKERRILSSCVARGIWNCWRLAVYLIIDDDGGNHLVESNWGNLFRAPPWFPRLGPTFVRCFLATLADLVSTFLLQCLISPKAAKFFYFYRA